MGMVIGIDVGGSTTKIIGVDKEGIKHPMIVKAEDPITSLFGAFESVCKGIFLFPTLQIWIVFLGKMPFIIIINRSHHKSILRLKVLFHFSGMQAFPRLHASLIRHIETDVVIPVVLCHIASPTFCLLFPDVLKAYSSNTHSPLH